MHQFYKLFCHESLHISDSSSVHHQEFIQCTPFLNHSLFSHRHYIVHDTCTSRASRQSLIPNSRGALASAFRKGSIPPLLCSPSPCWNPYLHRDRMDHIHLCAHHNFHFFFFRSRDLSTIRTSLKAPGHLTGQLPTPVPYSLRDSPILLSNGICHTAFEKDQDRTAVPSWSCSKAVYRHVWHTPLLSVQWINSWWWTDELSETCRFSLQNKFVKLVHLVGFITKKFVTMYGHMSQCTVTCHDARSHVTMHGHMLRCTVTCHDARSHVTMHGHMSGCTVTCYDVRSHVTMHGHISRCTVTCYNVHRDMWPCIVTYNARTVTCHDARSHVTMYGHMNVKFMTK